MTADVTTFSILRRSLISLCNEMAATLARVSYSPSISEGLDFAAGLFDSHGRLVACGDHDLSGLLGTLEPTLSLVRSTFGPEGLREGDIIVCNDPHEAGDHLNDVRMVKPVFVDGRVIAFLADVGHWTDIGGSTPGSINPLARDAYAEGLRITPLKLVDQGTFRWDVANMILANVRLPDESNADAWAQMKSLDAGEKRLKRLVDKYGVETVCSTFAGMHDHAEAIFRAEIAALRDGTVEFEDFIDADPLDPDKKPVRVHLNLEKANGRLLFDFTGSDPQPRAGNGSPWPLTHSGVFVATLNLFPKIPFNHGVIRNVDIGTAPGSVVHVLFPNPVSGCAAGGFEKVIACTLGCIGQLASTRKVAATYNLINVTVGGTDERFGRPFVMYLYSEGGFGGGPDRDGGDAPTQGMFATGSRNQPIEVQERFYPVLFTKLEIDEDSAGAGKWRGGPGITHGCRLTAGEAVIGVFGDRKDFKPWGVENGHVGGGQTVYVNRGLASEQELGMWVSEFPITAGDVIEVKSSGGGGYGDPLERDTGLVLRDVMLGFVSQKDAYNVYGVVVECRDPKLWNWHLDEDGTSRLRAALRQESSSLQRDGVPLKNVSRKPRVKTGEGRKGGCS